MVCTCIDSVYWFHFMTGIGIGIEGSGIGIGIVNCGIGIGIDRSPLYPESNSVPRFGDGGKAEAAQMREKPPGL